VADKPLLISGPLEQQFPIAVHPGILPGRGDRLPGPTQGQFLNLKSVLQGLLQLLCSV
jgi:hypothetical protein